MEVQMDERHAEVQHLSRAERIREETRRALDLGFTPKTPISIASNFRVEGLAHVAPPRAAAPGRRFTEMSRVKVAAVRDGNPYLREENPALLSAQLKDELKRLTPESRHLQSAAVLDLLSRLQAADPHGEANDSLRRKALVALFGDRFLKSEDGLSHERGAHGRGGRLSAEEDRS
jgi:hypothetical protein